MIFCSSFYFSLLVTHSNDVPGHLFPEALTQLTSVFVCMCDGFFLYSQHAAEKLILHTQTQNHCTLFYLEGVQQKKEKEKSCKKNLRKHVINILTVSYACNHSQAMIEMITMQKSRKQFGEMTSKPHPPPPLSLLYFVTKKATTTT